MIKENSEGLVIKLKIVPNSSKNDIVLEDEFVKIKITVDSPKMLQNQLKCKFSL